MDSFFSWNTLNGTVASDVFLSDSVVIVDALGKAFFGSDRKALWSSVLNTERRKPHNTVSSLLHVRPLKHGTGTPQFAQIHKSRADISREL
jgi:hypothetical protein